VNALDKLEAFSSINGPRFYGLDPSSGSIELVRENWDMVRDLAWPNLKIVPMKASQTLKWSILH